MIVQLAGQQYTMRYTVNSLCALEDRAGRPIPDLMALQFSATRLLLWAGLTEEQPEMSLRDVGALIDEFINNGGTLELIVDLCAQGLREGGFFGPDEKEGEDY